MTTTTTKTYNITYDGASYTLAPSADNKILLIKFGDNCEKYIKVESDDNYIYKILKTKIKAQGGADGLATYIKKRYEEHFCECMANVIMFHMLYKIKEATV